MVVYMGGQRIDDHKNFAGGASKGSVFPEGVKVKSEPDDGSDGHLDKYEDTTEAIRAQQEMSVKKAKAHAQKPGVRY